MILKKISIVFLFVEYDSGREPQYSVYIIDHHVLMEWLFDEEVFVNQEIHHNQSVLKYMHQYFVNLELNSNKKEFD